MNEIQVFNNPEFGQIRTMTLPDGQVGFVGKDVAEVLGYQNHQPFYQDPLPTPLLLRQSSA